MRFKRAFSRKDLLAIIICAFFLLAVMGSVGKKGRENAKRMVCASNISELLEGMTVYAGEHDGSLPYEEGGNWIWDVDYDVINALLDCMGTDVQEPSDMPVQDVFYCPSNIPQKKARDIYWTYGYYDFPPFRVIGYLFLWAARWNGYSGEFVSSIYVDNPAETELVIDIVMSDENPMRWPQDEYPNGNFARITCGGMPYHGIYDSSSHLITEKEPAGGNIGFVDGHVTWRPFSQMENRLGTIYDCPVFWW
jgi:prepilin-type processing-associated H-X9-DG protein